MFLINAYGAVNKWHQQELVWAHWWHLETLLWVYVHWLVGIHNWFSSISACRLLCQARAEIPSADGIFQDLWFWAINNVAIFLYPVRNYNPFWDSHGVNALHTAPVIWSDSVSAKTISVFLKVIMVNIIGRCCTARVELSHHKGFGSVDSSSSMLAERC